MFLIVVSIFCCSPVRSYCTCHGIRKCGCKYGWAFTGTRPVFTKRTYARHLLVKTSNSEFHETLTKGFVTDTTLETGGQPWSHIRNLFTRQPGCHCAVRTKCLTVIQVNLTYVAALRATAAPSGTHRGTASHSFDVTRVSGTKEGGQL